MDNETTERDQAIDKVFNEFTARQLAEHLVDRESEIERLDKERSRLNRTIGADDWRVKELLTEMYDTMVNNSCAHLWSIFVDSIDGMPDLSVRKYSGTVTLTFSFDGIEIPGDCSDWEIEDKILQSLDGELSYGYEDSYDVEYTED